MNDLISKKAVLEAIGNVSITVKGEPGSSNAVKYILGLIMPEVKKAIEAVPVAVPEPVIHTDLIDRKEIDCYLLSYESTDFIKSCLQRIKPVDAVPVIRCKDCRFFSPNLSRKEDYGTCSFPGTPYGIHPSPNFFCLCGEPAENLIDSVNNLGGANNGETD